MDSIFRSNGLSLKVSSDNTIVISDKIKEYVVPSDNVLTHVNLAWFTAHKLNINPNLVLWPSVVNNYNVGDLGVAFGEAPTREGDVAAMECYTNTVADDFTPLQWGGVFETPIECLFDSNGEAKKFEAPYYINALVPTSIAKIVSNVNPQLVKHVVDKGRCRLVGGTYNHAKAGVLPPLTLSTLNEVDLKMILHDVGTVVELVRPKTPVTNSTIDFRAISELNGTRLRDKLRSAALINASKNATASVRKNRLAKFVNYGMDVDEVDIKGVIGEAIALGRGDNNITAYLLRQVEQKFAVDFETGLAVNRALIVEEEDQEE